MNDSLEWTEHLLKRNLNSLSYFEKICWLWKCFFLIMAGAGAGAENVFFFGSGSSKKLRLRLRNTGFLNLFRCMFWPLINDFSPSFSLFFPRLHSSIFFPAAIFPHLYMGSSGRGVPAPQGQKNVDFWTSLRCIFRPLSEDFFLHFIHYFFTPTQFHF